MTILDELKEQLQEDVLTWTSGLESLDDEKYGVARMLTDSGPAWNPDDNDITRLCQIIINRVNEYKRTEDALCAI